MDFSWLFFQFKCYTRVIYKIPDYVYVLLGSLLIIGFVIFLVKNGFRKGIRYSALLMLAEYVMIIIGATVIYRKTDLERRIDLHPLWSYQAFYNGHTALLMEIVMNVVLFIPIGFLLGVSFRNINLSKVVLVSSCLSVLIEVLQFAMKRGLAEVDDVLHNLLGCAIGYGLYEFLRYVYEKISKRRVAVL